MLYLIPIDVVQEVLMIWKDSHSICWGGQEEVYNIIFQFKFTSKYIIHGSKSLHKMYTKNFISRKMVQIYYIPSAKHI